MFDVTLTLPSDFLGENVTQEQLDQEVQEEEGLKSAVLNEDGSVTYVMTKTRHAEMVNEIRASIDEELSALPGSEEYPTVVRIEANEDYTSYKVVLNTEEPGLSEGLLEVSLFLYSGIYHVFNGTAPGNVRLQFVNEATGAVIREDNSSDLNNTDGT